VVLTIQRWDPFLAVDLLRHIPILVVHELIPFSRRELVCPRIESKLDI
jgi:hypothetical protein